MQRENIFTQASFSQPVWEQAMKVIDLFENGKLDNQRLKKRNYSLSPNLSHIIFSAYTI